MTGAAALWPDANLAWRVALPSSYDALGIRAYEQLSERLAADRERWRAPRFVDERFLRLFGVRFVLGELAQAELPERVHLLTALHACDTATDDALAVGIQRGADHLAVVPCCQAEVAQQLKDSRPKVRAAMGALGLPFVSQEGHRLPMLNAIAAPAGVAESPNPPPPLPCASPPPPAPPRTFAAGITITPSCSIGSPKTRRTVRASRARSIISSGCGRFAGSMAVSPGASATIPLSCGRRRRAVCAGRSPASPLSIRPDGTSRSSSYRVSVPYQVGSGG
jgi:hypothetical protein